MTNSFSAAQDGLGTRDEFDEKAKGVFGMLYDQRMKELEPFLDSATSLRALQEDEDTYGQMLRIAAALRAEREAGRAEATPKWRPIETAPKDRDILVWWENSKIFGVIRWKENCLDGRWVEGCDCEMIVDGMVSWTPLEPPENVERARAALAATKPASPAPQP